MATLQKIRTRAGVLIAIVIGISLAAFVLGDALQSGSSIMRSSQMEVGEVNGESIQYTDFAKDVEELGNIYRQNSQQSQLDENGWAQVREQAWQNNVQEIVMTDVYDKLGIEISSDELFDMLQGANLHPVIQQLFRNQTTGQVDKGAVINFLKNLDSGNVTEEQRSYWLYLENQIVKDRLQSKYSQMIGKGLYITTNEARKNITLNNNSVNFDYIALTHLSVPDSSVKVTEKELTDYYNAHKSEFKQEKSRDIEYIIFPVKPSAADYKDAENWIGKIKPDYTASTDNVQFVNANSDVSYKDTWYKKETLPANVGAWVYDDKAQKNDILGPYFENEAYFLAKVDSLAMMPDSVKARHILLQVTTQDEVARTQKLADSLKTVIEKGGDFATLAMIYSKDQGSAIKGGDLGWFGRGQMVKPFEDAAFNNNKNQVTVVASQFGLHIIQTTEKGKLSPQVKVAFLVRNVIASTRTEQEIYATASKFAYANTTAEKFNAGVTAEKMSKRTANLRENDVNIIGLENARPLVHAAYKAEVGQILKTNDESPIFSLGNNFVIAVLTKATEEGEASFADAKTRVELAVIKQKKTELLVKRLESAASGKSDLQSIAGQLNTEVKNAASINFNSFSISGIGMEPAVVGTVASLEPNKISKPIEGNNGVYLAMVTSQQQGTSQDVKSEQLRLSQSIGYRASSQVVESQKKKAEIVDKRSKFY